MTSRTIAACAPLNDSAGRTLRVTEYGPQVPVSLTGCSPAAATVVAAARTSAALQKVVGRRMARPSNP